MANKVVTKFVPDFTNRSRPLKKAVSEAKNTTDEKKSSLEPLRPQFNVIRYRKEENNKKALTSENVTKSQQNRHGIKRNFNSSKFETNAIKRQVSIISSKKGHVIHEKVDENLKGITEDSGAISNITFGKSPSANSCDSERTVQNVRKNIGENSKNFALFQEISNKPSLAVGSVTQSTALDLAREIVQHAELSQRDSLIKAGDRFESESADYIKSDIGLTRNEVLYKLIIHARFAKVD